MFLDRSPDRDTAHLAWRVRLLSAGAALGLLGMFFEEGWLVWTAIGVLLAGFLLRFLPGGDGGGEADDPSGREEEDRARTRERYEER